jgi:glycerol kinase
VLLLLLLLLLLLPAVLHAAFTTRGHVVHAMLEAICFQTREVLVAMILRCC